MCVEDEKVGQSMKDFQTSGGVMHIMQQGGQHNQPPHAAKQQTYGTQESAEVNKPLGP